MAVAVEPDNLVPAFRVVGTQKLFGGPYIERNPTYDVSRDGERFLMIKEDETSTTDGGSDLVVVLDWFEELNRLVP